MTDSTDTIDITFKKNYVKDHLSILIIIVLLQIGLITGLGGFIFYQLQSSPKPIFFTVTEHKQVIAPVPLGEPDMNAAAILNWAVEAVRVSYSFNYHSIQNHFAKIYCYFDKRGLDWFFKTIANDFNMQQVASDKLIVSAQAREAPKIIKEGKIEGRYAWRIILPMAMRYENATIVRRQDVDIDIYIWRVPETEAPIGIQITNLSVEVKHNYEQQAAGKK